MIDALQKGVLKFCALTLLMGLATTGCVTSQPYDYTAFKQSRPASILVLPPVNMSPEVVATNGLLSQVTFPLAESGYYVFPVTLVTETFHQNGLTNPADMHNVPFGKLREIFGADAALYLTIKEYGTTYVVISSESRVTAEARLIDLKTGKDIWTGSATASSAEGRNSSGGLIGLLVASVINQIVENATDRSHAVAGITSARLLSADAPNGILYGPRSPRYNQSPSQ